MQFSTLGLETTHNDKGALQVTAGQGVWLDMPLTGIEANEMARGCWHFLTESNLPEEWLGKHNIESRISDALQSETLDAFWAIEEEILGYFAVHSEDATPDWREFSRILEEGYEEHGPNVRVWQAPNGRVYCTPGNISEPEARQLGENEDYEWDGMIYARL